MKDIRFIMEYGGNVIRDNVTNETYDHMTLDGITRLVDLMNDMERMRSFKVNMVACYVINIITLAIVVVICILNMFL